jgi:DinB superfamily
MDLSYPIGKFDFSQSVAPGQLPGLIEQIAAAPANFRAAVSGLSDKQLDTPYRPDGWTVRQTIHHVADSHMNSFIRVRLALTEDEPPIKGYDQAAWGELSDSRTAPVDVSLQLIESLHLRWVFLLKTMAADDFARGFKHSELGVLRLDKVVALYAWHGRHHCAHITGLRERNGWK